MGRITVSNAIAEKLKRFPKKVYVCDDDGNSHNTIVRAGSPDEVSEDRILTNEQIVQTLQDIFTNELKAPE